VDNSPDHRARALRLRRAQGPGLSDGEESPSAQLGRGALPRRPSRATSAPKCRDPRADVPMALGSQLDL